MSRATNDLQRRPHDDRPVDHVFGEHDADVRRRAVGDGVDRRAAGALVAHPAAVRVDLGEGLRQPRFTSASSRSRRSCPRSARSRRKRCRASASSAPTGRRRAELERFRASIDEYCGAIARLIVLQGFFFPSMGFFLGLGALLVVWLGSREVIAGRITVGQFVAFNSYLTMLSWPMIAFGWVTNMLQRGMASWKRMTRGPRRRAGDCRHGSGISGCSGSRADSWTRRSISPDDPG